MKKTIRLFDKKKFDACLADLEEKGENFDYVVDGSVLAIQYGDRKIQYVDISQVEGSGFHLTTIIRKEVDKWLVENPGKVVKDTNQYPTQLYNLSAIERVYKTPCVAIDLSNCYFSTIYKLGYISRKVYDQGMSNPSWKIGRNASVGSLAKKKFVWPYINGKKDLLAKRVIESPDEYKWIRNNVLGHVYRVFEQLRKEIGDDFLMWLTDCVYAPEHRKEYIENFFREYGYRFKSANVIFLKPNREKKIVYWQDKDKAEMKYINYSSRQIIN